MFSKGYGVEFVVLVFLYTIVTVIKRANKGLQIPEIRRIP